jgi:thiol-disulfide isomerase/thioredoxin
MMGGDVYLRRFGFDRVLPDVIHMRGNSTMKLVGLRPVSLFMIALVFSLLAGWMVWAADEAAAAPAQQSGEPVVIYFFWGDGCPHCETAKPFLQELTQRYPNVYVREFEVWYKPENQQPLRQMAAKFGFQPSGVPVTFIGQRHWVGYAPEPVGREIESYVAACVASSCPDAGAGIFDPLPPPPSVNTQIQPERPTVTEGVAVAPADALTDAAVASSGITLPFIGTIDLASRSLFMSTALIAFVDGFNPCSLWVLSILLALSMHTGSRRKIFTIGFVFITVTAFVYALFIVGLFSVFTFAGFSFWIHLVMASVALVFAVINIKDYFWYKEGVSLTIADDKKPGIYQRIRRVLNASDSYPSLIGATIILAAGVSLVEFTCTAGFPVVWTNLLLSQEATVGAFVMLLLLYMLIYQLDELAIFGVAVVTLKASRFEESHGRTLKLIGGMLMLTLAVVMLVDPSLMGEIESSLWVFGGAFAATLLVLLLHRRVLPRMGIYIGDEMQPATPSKKRSRPRRA